MQQPLKLTAMTRTLKLINLITTALWCWAPFTQLQAIPWWVISSGNNTATEPSGVFEPYVATFDGVNDYINYKVVSGTAPYPTGLADGYNFTFSTHLKMGASSDGVRYRLFDIAVSSGNRILSIYRDENNKIYILGKNSGEQFIFQLITTTATITEASEWVHLYICINIQQAVGLNKIYINGVPAAFTNITPYLQQAGVIDMLAGVAPIYTIGASGNTSPIERFKGSMTELWFNDSYIDDLSKFTSLNVPISLGANGELPLGTVPVFYFSRTGGGNSWSTNAGTAQNMIVTGTLDTGTYP